MYRNHLRIAAVPGADAVCVAGHRPGVRRFLLPADAAGGSGTDLVSDAERRAGEELQQLESQLEARLWHALDPRTHPACANGGVL